MTESDGNTRTDFDRGSEPDEDLPDFSTPEWEAHIRRHGVVQRGPGRPPAARPKGQTTLRLDAEVVDRFRAEGPGWQTRMNAALRKAAGL